MKEAIDEKVKLRGNSLKWGYKSMFGLWEIFHLGMDMGKVNE